MSNALVKIEFNEDQVSLIKNTIAKDATDNELKLFLYQCQRTGLDPMTRQIYFMKRAGKVTIQTSIDGFRVIAERSGDYAGQDEPIFCKEDGELFCKVTVYRFRGDVRYPAAVGVAYWKEYCPQSGQDFMWKKMPHTMLSKVAEALALRKAYPQDLSGLYTGDEMNQSDQLTGKQIEEEMLNEEIGHDERDELLTLLERSTYEGKAYNALQAKIEGFKTWEEYNRAKDNLLSNQSGIDGTVNPSAKQISKQVKAISKQPAA